MPIVQFNVSGPVPDDAAVKSMLEEASSIYAQILECPVSRVRAMYIPHDYSLTALQGEVQRQRMVFFEFIVLEGRSLGQRSQLAIAFTDLCVRRLGIDRDLIRGRCERVEPEDWCIGGRFASDLRDSEILARKNT